MNGLLMNNIVATLSLFLLQHHTCLAFFSYNNVVVGESIKRLALRTKYLQILKSKWNENDDGNDESKITIIDSLERRDLCTSFLFVGASSLLGVAATNPPQAANAQGDPRLFKPNPLANRALEQIRIWDQTYADDIKYGGELEKGDAGKRATTNTYANLLVPIVILSQDLSKVNAMVLDRSKWQEALTLLSTPQFQKLQFMKIFNAYADNIYYKDTDRANLYLGGGATPQKEQSIAYLLRNDILTNVESLQAELEYLLRPTTLKEETTDDLLLYAKTAKNAMESYLAIAPPKEVQTAIEIVQKGE